MEKKGHECVYERARAFEMSNSKNNDDNKKNNK